MKTARLIRRFASRHVSAAVLALTLSTGFTLLRADIQVDVLNTKTGTFTNVTVYNLTKTDVFFRHSRGMANIKLRDLDETALWQLHLGDCPAPAVKSAAPTEGKVAPAQKNDGATTSAGATSQLNKLDAAQQELTKLKEQLREKLKPVLANLATKFSAGSGPTLLGIVAALAFAFYLFWCQCLSLICSKTGNKPGVLVWLPILQIFPMFRAASMSGWWFLALFIPVLNVITQIVWCFKIAKARGKSAWVGFFLLVPGISLFAFLYLAFSNGVSGEEEHKQVRIARAPAALAEA